MKVQERYNKIVNKEVLGWLLNNDRVMYDFSNNDKKLLVTNGFIMYSIDEDQLYISLSKIQKTAYINQFEKSEYIKHTKIEYMGPHIVKYFIKDNFGYISIKDFKPVNSLIDINDLYNVEKEPGKHICRFLVPGTTDYIYCMPMRYTEVK